MSKKELQFKALKGIIPIKFVSGYISLRKNLIEMGQINNFILVKYYNKAVKGGKL